MDLFGSIIIIIIIVSNPTIIYRSDAATPSAFGGLHSSFSSWGFRSPPAVISWDLRGSSLSSQSSTGILGFRSLRRHQLGTIHISLAVFPQRLKMRSQHPLRRAFSLVFTILNIRPSLSTFGWIYAEGGKAFPFSLVFTILNVRPSLSTFGWIYAEGGQGLPSPKLLTSVYSLSKSQGQV